MSDDTGFQLPPGVPPEGTPTGPTTSLNDPNSPPQFDVVPWDDPEKLPLKTFILTRSFKAFALFIGFSFVPIMVCIGLKIPLWEAMVIAGSSGISVVGTALMLNIAKTGRMTRRDVDVALAMGANSLPQMQYALQTPYTYMRPY